MGANVRGEIYQNREKRAPVKKTAPMKKMTPLLVAVLISFATAFPGAGSSRS
jgi:hypothetical protein